jgi:hypothetical protein
LTGKRRFALVDHFRGNSSRISRLPTLPDGSGEGRLEMTQANQIKKNDAFRLAIVIRIEGRNSRAIILRFAGVAAALIAAGAKIVAMFIARAP